MNKKLIAGVAGSMILGAGGVRISESDQRAIREELIKPEVEIVDENFRSFVRIKNKGAGILSPNSKEQKSKLEEKYQSMKQEHVSLLRQGKAKSPGHVLISEHFWEEEFGEKSGIIENINGDVFEKFMDL